MCIVQHFFSYFFLFYVITSHVFIIIYRKLYVYVYVWLMTVTFHKIHLIAFTFDAQV